MITKTIQIVRGDYTTLEWALNYAPSGSIHFTVKGTKSLTAARLVDKQCSIVDGNKVQVLLESSDTQNLQNTKYVYDLTEIDGNKEITHVSGVIDLISDVRTPYDTTIVDPEKYIPVAISKFTNGQYVKAVVSGGEIEFVGHNTISNGLFEIDVNGGLMPKENPDSDEFYEYDINGDIMPKSTGEAET